MTTSSMAEYGYNPSVLPKMIAIARRQRAKDRIFVQTLARLFRPGPILEIGAGCGQLSELLMSKGLDVMASDIQPFLVEYMQSRGLPATIVDATDISSGIDEPYESIFAQALSTLINPDNETIRRTYQSVHDALNPAGRFVFILPSAMGERWSSASDHVRIAESVGFRVIRRFRHQALSSPLYARLPVALLRVIDGSVGRIIGVRWVLVFERRS